MDEHLPYLYGHTPEEFDEELGEAETVDLFHPRLRTGGARGLRLDQRTGLFLTLRLLPDFSHRARVYAAIQGSHLTASQVLLLIFNFYFII